MRPLLHRTMTLLLLMLLLTVSTAHAESKMLFTVRIPFEVGGAVTVHRPNGETRELGTVVMLPDKTRWPSYTASAWGKPGTVAASAVNAIHMLVAVEEGQGRTMSVIPRETIAPAAGAGASIVLDIKAGHGLFGAWAPPVGTIVTVEAADGTTSPLGMAMPAQGGALIFEVSEDSLPYMVDFENRPGGRVIAWSERGGAELIARVIHPVAGVGRFDGTLFQDVGRIRANHSGVIDVSTSPFGTIGGFQIIPLDHGVHSKEMQNAWSMTQWMILGPVDGASEMGGTYPLFSGGLVPGTASDEELWDLWSTYGRKPRVEARIDGGDWTRLPEVPGRSDDALRSITHLRIYFPHTEEPLSKD